MKSCYVEQVEEALKGTAWKIEEYNNEYGDYIKIYDTAREIEVGHFPQGDIPPKMFIPMYIVAMKYCYNVINQQELYYEMY